MESSQTAKLTPKAERTRQRILDTALALFAAHGYEATTLREIAAKADCSLGLTYRYFTRKEDMVLALYRHLAEYLEAQAQALPPERLADRFSLIMRTHFAQLTPYREACAALFGAALNPRSGVGVLGTSTAEIRTQVTRLFVLVVTGASDAPSERQATDLATVLFWTHLGLLLFWLQDGSPQQLATQELVAWTHDGLAFVRPLLRLAPVSGMLGRLTRVMGLFWQGDPATAPTPTTNQNDQQPEKQ